MEIKRFVSKQILTNMYVIEDNEHAIILDPCIENIDLNNLIVDFILLTHEHYDHILSLNYWKDKTDAKVICSTICGKNIENPRKNLSHYFKEFVELQTWITDIDIPLANNDIEDYIGKADILFDNEYILDWQGHVIRLFETPGHSLGSSCIVLDNKWLFSGDTLFKDYPTVCNLPGGTKKKWNDYTKLLLMSLDNRLHIYPGHLEDFDLIDYKFWEMG